MANDGGETAARIYEAGRTQRDDDQATAMLKRLLADARAEVASLLSQLREARAELEVGRNIVAEFGIKLGDAQAEVASFTAIRERAEDQLATRTPTGTERDPQINVLRFILGAAPSPEPPPTLSERNEGPAPQHDEPPPDAAPSFTSDGYCTRHGSFACLTCRERHRPPPPDRYSFEVGW